MDSNNTDSSFPTVNYECIKNNYEELLISGDEEKTMNSKIFKSNEDFITLKEFENILLVMQEAIANDDVGTIVNNMKKYVSGFKNDKAST